MKQLTVEEVVSLIVEQPAQQEFLETLKIENGEWKTDDEIKAALKEAYSGRLKKVVDEQKGRAVRERMTAIQKSIREKWGVESDGQLEDHLQKLVESIEAKGGKEKIVEKTIELTEENARTNPVVQKLLKSEVVQRASDLEKERDEWKTKYSEYIEKAEREKLDAAVYTESDAVLTGIKAAIDKDPEKRAKQVRMFIAGLKSGYSFKLDEAGKPYPVNANGEPLEDPKTFSRITFADLVKQENIFGVHDFDPEKGSPGATSQPTSPQRFTGAVPKTMEEYQSALTALPGPENKAKREALLQVFEAAQKTGGK